MFTTATLLGSLALAACAVAQPKLEQLYEEHRATVPGNRQSEPIVRSYRLMRPETEPEQSYPLVLFLHGAGERGSDNSRQLRHLPAWLASERARREHPCYVLAPQCAPGEWWVDGDARRALRSDAPVDASPSNSLRAALAALEDVMRREPVDPDRVYLTGLSMGGFGAWELAMREPERFAALLPICGGGDARRAAALKTMPIWAFHGAEDPVVPLRLSRLMVEAVRRAGGSAKLTELDGVGHDAWTHAYRRSGALAWLFEQRRTAAAAAPSGDAAADRAPKRQDPPAHSYQRTAANRRSAAGASGS